MTLMLCVGLHFSASAQDTAFKPAAGTCVDADGGVFRQNTTLPTIDISNQEENAAGHEETTTWNDDLGYDVTCDCTNPTDNAVHERTVSTLPSVHYEDGHQFYEVNDNLQAAAEIYIASHRNAYFNIPFDDESTGEPTPHNKQCYPLSSVWHDAASGKIIFRISKPFVGITRFNHVKLFSLYAARNSTMLGAGQPIVDVYISGVINAPQSCTLDAGQTITMDFGNIAASSFVKAGAGNIPENVNPQSHNILIKCRNFEVGGLFSVRIESDNASGNIIISDNKDVGFILGDKERRPITPNDTESRIPFRLDDNASSNVTITGWPVSVTGTKPAEGRFTAESYLRIDFD